jgi:hypothetical protein
MESDPTTTSTSEVLERLQKETQRVRNRLSPEKSTKREDPQAATPIEQPRDNHFDDPVPPEIMSDHEAFRAKYVSLFSCIQDVDSLCEFFM